ncbi:hypothetical protein [Saccharopolyspora hattusasensis]|uniref:hypothetical protein n=1 Tax=Saccharopolyspora hattusasensis TaxID=1128679 RepID=UPI003D969ABC
MINMLVGTSSASRSMPNAVSRISSRAAPAGPACLLYANQDEAAGLPVCEPGQAADGWPGVRLARSPVPVGHRRRPGRQLRVMKWECGRDTLSVYPMFPEPFLQFAARHVSSAFFKMKKKPNFKARIAYCDLDVHFFGLVLQP